jgi:hypothetical protein
MTHFIAEIETRVAGIPCIIGVVNYECVRGSYSRNAASDWDYAGYTESDWEVLDRRGRPAPWLQRKVGDDDVERIESEIQDYFAESWDIVL